MVNSDNKSGLATASLVLGIIGIALSFIPIINNAAFVLGILALIFGIISLVKKSNKGKSIAGLILGILAIIITLVMQQAIVDTANEAEKNLDKAFGNSTEEVLKNEANVTLGEFEVSEGQYGLVDTKMIVTVKNISDEKKSFTFHIEAVNSDGSRLDDDYVYANDLNAGQTQEFEIFNLVTSDQIDALKTATFNIVEASSM